MKKTPWILLMMLVILFSTALPAQADGIIIPPPCPADRCPPIPCPGFDCPPIPARPMEQLVIRYHRVNVTIEDQIAVTRVDQVFHNPNEWSVEGTYVFPLPAGAAVSDFTLWVDDQAVKGEVLNAEEARQYYEDTVRDLRDPALLEYAGRGAVRASIFPIPPGGERRIELEYTQALVAEGGLVRYVYPLNTEKFSLLPLEEVSVKVQIRDQQAIRAVYSPSHPVDVVRDGEHSATAGYEASGVRPDTDFSLYYSTGETQAFHLFSYRDPADPSDPDGYFMLLLAPKPGENRERVAKDVLLVLDRSGSMDGEKFTQAQDALRYILKQLNPEDRFYLQSFSTGIETYASGLRPTREVDQALTWVDRLSAKGSTDINRALLEAAAAADRERPTYLIFLTDGLPTEGVVNTQQILDNFAATAPDNLRLFSFGVGYDVDTVLLDSLSQEHHGQSSYVRPGEPLNEALSAFYERISTPVLTDLALDFGSLATYDIYPDPLPDLFSGSQVIVVGRYRGGAETEVTLRGDVNGEMQTFRYPAQQFSADTRADPGQLNMLPRLWATRKIGYLLNRIRLDGPDKETIEQIVKLSVRYGIVTPYTSYLVTEPAPLSEAAQETMAEQAYGEAQAAPPAATGKGAVDRAAQEGAMRQADVAPAAGGGGDWTGQDAAGPDNQRQGAAIRAVGARTFIYQSGVWVDTMYDAMQMPVQQVAFLSEAYFKLLQARPDLAAALALGEQMIVVVDGQAYQVVAEGQSASTLDLPEPVTPSPVDAAETTISPRPESTSSPIQAAAAATTHAPAAAPGDTGRPPARACLAGLLPLAAVLGAALLGLRK